MRRMHGALLLGLLFGGVLALAASLEPVFGITEVRVGERSIDVRPLIPVAPLWALVAFGSYALASIGWALLRFGDCPEAAESLKEVRRRDSFRAGRRRPDVARRRESKAALRVLRGAWRWRGLRARAVAAREDGSLGPW